MHPLLQSLSCPAAVLALAAALDARPAASQLLAPVADGRYAYAEHCPQFEGCQSQSARPPSSFALFAGAASAGDTSASQQSSWSSGASAASISGSLAAQTSGEPTLANTLGDASLDLTFDATAAATWSWTGSGARSEGGYGGAILYDATSDEVLFETSLPAGFEASGYLSAGHRYQLLVHATVVGPGSADWGFELAAPEPGFHASLAGGVALLALLARRRG